MKEEGSGGSQMNDIWQAEQTLFWQRNRSNSPTLLSHREHISFDI
jgi:hypothetical protein